LNALAQKNSSNSTSAAAVSVRGVRYRYKDRVALDDLTFSVAPAGITAVLGPNGSGKSTLFRLLSTLSMIQEGSATIGNLDVATQRDGVRRLIGVVFQAPSLDKKLSVRENLLQHTAMYGIPPAEARERIVTLAARFGVADRLNERVESLSGGLQRRAELAKALLHRPRILLLDEPSTGLDPGARADLRATLEELRDRDGVTVLLTTHLIEEADFADRVLILHEGRLMAEGDPQELRGSVGGDVITLHARHPETAATAIKNALGLETKPFSDGVRLQSTETAATVSRLLPLLGGDFYEITVGRPTLEDVFFAKTGRLMADVTAPVETKKGGH